MTRRRDLRDLVGEDVPAPELERLRKVHDLLVAAGPPPELPPVLADAPALRAPGEPDAEVVRFLPRRRIGAALSLAAAVAVVAFGAGLLFGQARTDFESEREVAMRGTKQAPRASATIRIGESDPAGNTAMLVTVRGLPQLEGRAYYELYLTVKGRIVFSCGSFNTAKRAATFHVNVPYAIRPAHGWVVTIQRPPYEKHGPTVLTT